VSQSIVLRDLAELARYQDEFASDPEPTIATQVAMPPPALDDQPDQLVQAILRSARELQRLSEQDGAARREAETVLEQHRRLKDEAGRYRQIDRDAGEVVDGALKVVATAFLPRSQAEADQLVATASAVATVASNRLKAIETELAELEEREDLSRLLAIERTEREARQREEQALAAIERAKALASEHKYNEALRLLGSAVKLNPNMPGLASSHDTIRRQAHAVKTLEVERALADARRLHRREPGQAVEILGGLDLSGMPSVLVRDVYGCWLQSCRRLGLVEAVHYSPGTGKGAMLVRDSGSDTRLKVVSAIGLPSWTPGRTFAVRALKGARPLAA
jgi:tetratricopeptide (TPR) repeat protein